MDDGPAWPVCPEGSNGLAVHLDACQGLEPGRLQAQVEAARARVQADDVEAHARRTETMADGLQRTNSKVRSGLLLLPVIGALVRRLERHALLLRVRVDGRLGAAQ